MANLSIRIQENWSNVEKATRTGSVTTMNKEVKKDAVSQCSKIFVELGDYVPVQYWNAGTKRNVWCRVGNSGGPNPAVCMVDVPISSIYVVLSVGVKARLDNSPSESGAIDELVFSSTDVSSTDVSTYNFELSSVVDEVDPRNWNQQIRASRFSATESVRDDSNDPQNPDNLLCKSIDELMQLSCVCSGEISSRACNVFLREVIQWYFSVFSSLHILFHVHLEFRKVLII